MHFAKLHDLMLIEFHYISHDWGDIPFQDNPHEKILKPI